MSGNTSRLVLTVLTAALLTWSGSQAVAANLWWDGDANGVPGGSGTWDLTSAVWLDAYPTGNQVVWTNGNAAYFYTTAGTVTIANGTTISATGVTFHLVPGFVINAAGTGVLTFSTGNLSVYQNATINAPITSITSGGGNLNKSQAGTLTLTGSNTYTGATSIAAGAISVSSVGNYGTSLASNLGSPGTETQGAIYMGSGTSTGTLIYTGSGETTNRYISLGSNNNAGGGTIQTDGSGALVFTHNFANNGTPTTAGTRLLTLQGSSTANNEIQGAISDVDTGAGKLTGITKNQAGKWILSGASTYSGGTTINAGTLLVNNTTGSGTGAGDVSVTGGTLGGTGTIGGNVSVSSGAFLAPGASVGTLSVGGNVQINGTLKIELDGTGAGSADKLAVTGGLDISNATVDFNELVAVDDAAYIFATYGSLNGTQFANVLNKPTGYDIVYNYNGNQIALVIPEPASLSLLGLGGLLMLVRRRREA